MREPWVSAEGDTRNPVVGVCNGVLIGARMARGQDDRQGYRLQAVAQNQMPKHAGMEWQLGGFAQKCFPCWSLWG